MDHQGSLRWIELLPKVVRGYNNSTHRSIGLPPNKVSVDNSRDVWRYLFGRQKEKVRPRPSTEPIVSNVELVSHEKPKKKKKRKPKFQKGDRVWASDKKLNKNAFEKGYKSKWRTEDVYSISNVLDKEDPITYRLKDSQGKVVPGQFYQEQLQKVPDA